MDSKPTVLLIDFSSIFRRAWAVASEVSIAYQATIGGVNRCVSLTPGALTAICLDGRNNWRKKLSPEYKAHREKQPASLFGEMDRTVDRLRKDGFLIWQFDGYEADDLIGTACMIAHTRQHPVRIASADKDLLQLLGPGVDYLATHTYEIKTHVDVLDKYGVEATQFADWLALVGDSSDNVKGAPGIGPKTAAALLQKHQSIQGIYHAMSEPCEMCRGNERPDICEGCLGSGKRFEPVSTPANVKSLDANRENVALARKLVSLSRDVPLSFDEIYETRELDANERDTMSEAEQDANATFDDSPQNEVPTAVTLSAAADQPGPEQTGSIVAARPDDLKKTELAPVQAAVVLRNKTPEEIESVSRPTETAPVVEYSRQLEPRSLKEASIYADLMFYSKVYSRYPTKQSILAAIVRGREMGYDAGASLDIFHVADFRNDGNLKLMIHAHVVIDRAMRDPSLEYFKLVSSNSEHATYEAKVKRNAEPTPITYTIEDARKAGLVKPGSNWEKRPTEQCRKTAGVLLARAVAPWSAMGLYCPEEMGIDE